jgi:hypothetical protein
MSFTRFQHCHTLHCILFSRAGLMTFRSLLRENQTSFCLRVISPISTPQPRMTTFQLVLYVAIPHHQRTVVDQAVSTTSPSAQQVQLSGSEHYVWPKSNDIVYLRLLLSKTRAHYAEPQFCVLYNFVHPHHVFLSRSYLTHQNVHMLNRIAIMSTHEPSRSIIR